MTGKITKPILAETVDTLEVLQYPVMVSAKLDGIRQLKLNGKSLTRKFEPMPNKFVADYIEANMPDGIDGEIMVDGMNFNQIQHLIMSEDGEPDFYLAAFDYVSGELTEPFKDRHANLVQWAKDHPEVTRLKVVAHPVANNRNEVLDFEQEYLDAGAEGLMIRKIDGKYKCGRSGVKEAILLKLKRFKDAEAIVIDILPQMKNDNEAEKDNVGHTKRSKKKAGMTQMATLGKFVVRDIETGLEFKLGTGLGLTKDVRKEIYDNKDKYMGKIVKYKFQVIGQKNLPRFPVWLGFRDPRDM